MCVRISDSVAFWWPPATRSKKRKFLVLETSCITHTYTHAHTHTHTTHTYTHTNTHTHTHTHTFLAVILFLPAASNEYVFKLICTKAKNGGGL